jgi:hypothetical protein
MLVLLRGRYVTFLLRPMLLCAYEVYRTFQQSFAHFSNESGH